MITKDPKLPKDSEANHLSGLEFLESYRKLSQRVLRSTNRGLSKNEFIQAVCRALLDLCHCDQVSVWVKKGDGYYYGTAEKDRESFFSFDSVSRVQASQEVLPSLRDQSDLGLLCDDVFQGNVDFSADFFTKSGSFWTGDSRAATFTFGKKNKNSAAYKLNTAVAYPSLAIIPIIMAEERTGLLVLASRQVNALAEPEILMLELFSESLGITLITERAQLALRERIKELSCLYAIAQIAEEPQLTLDQILARTVELLPPAWQYPEVSAARISLDGKTFQTSNFRDGEQKQSSEVVVSGEKKGEIEVVYLEKRPPLDEGPFLKEERNLIDTLATQLALIVERKQAEEEKARLQEQLRHADRLATIGQLTAGVAHELNEPLGNILGFAQLAKKYPQLPDQVSKDLEKIVTASLHSREVIKKLMLFSRQMPTKKVKVNLNNLVEQGLYFLSSRCAKADIKLERILSPEVPEITADPSQLYQVLVNLVVNSIQAMPQGGRLTIRTLSENDHVLLMVEDTGIGMSPEILAKIFLPFFTTKDINEGTGLGLAVVHGIVTSHSGKIKVESEVGKGSRFTVILPVKPIQIEKEIS
jgi:signal transduction histidine kinase